MNGNGTQHAMLLVYMVLTNATVIVATACITAENRLFNYILHMVPITTKVPHLIHVFLGCNESAPPKQHIGKFRHVFQGSSV